MEANLNKPLLFQKSNIFKSQNDHKHPSISVRQKSNNPITNCELIRAIWNNYLPIWWLVQKNWFLKSFFMQLTKNGEINLKLWEDRVHVGDKSVKVDILRKSVTLWSPFSWKNFVYRLSWHRISIWHNNIFWHQNRVKRSQIASEIETRKRNNQRDRFGQQ